MSKKMMKKLVCNTMAVLSVSACLGVATACETAHPEVEMTIVFNDKEYVLEYELYRNIAPSTVNHFLTLVDKDYYDGLCVHNYDDASAKMYTGVYSVATDASDEDGLTYKPYYETVAKYENFPVSVWMDAEKSKPLYSVYGEFDANGFTVENGAKKQSYGSLTMYYFEKDTKAKAYAPYLSEEKAGEVATREYKYNSATSQFYISLSTTVSASSKYCTFATLKEDSVEVLQELQEAIADFAEEAYAVEDDESAISEFTTKHTVAVDIDDPIVGNKTKTQNFLVPNEPIVIKEIVTKKY